MTIQKQIRHVGDLRIAIAATLQRPDDTAVDLTGLTVYFKMVDSQDNVVVAKTTTGVTVTGATAGQVQYSPVAADVDAEGTYYGYFIVSDGTKEETFPVEKGGFEIEIHEDA